MEDAMSTLLIDDKLWELIAPVLPKWAPSPMGGQPRKPDRVCLTGILFVLKTGIAWEDFPHELGCCGMTLWNRLEQWMKAGVWPTLHCLLLSQLRGADQIDFSRVIVDSGSVRAILGGSRPARTRRIAANAARSTTWFRMPAARRWRSRSPARIGTTARN